MNFPLQKSGCAAIGECMLELSGSPQGHGASTLTLGFGGDTLNTALYMSRLGAPCQFVSAVGDDQHSDWLLSQWQSEGIGVDHVARIRGRVPGLYWITTDAQGERSFSYWRSESPARELFDESARANELLAALRDYGLIYFSGITLSLYGDVGLERFFDLLTELRKDGAIIAFDGNFRPRGWSSVERARSAFTRACGLSHLVLPTFDDEVALFGDDSPAHAIDRILALGADEVVLKLGANGCIASDTNSSVPVSAPEPKQPVDTTAAGDSFNAAYIAARMRGADKAAAANSGNALAGEVIMHRGAVIPLSAMPLVAFGAL